MRKDSQPQRRPKGKGKGKGRASPAAEPRANLYDEVTAKIIAELEAGTFPWVRPWGRAGAGRPGLPRNAATGRRYSGVNVLLLWGAGFSEGYHLALESTDATAMAAISWTYPQDRLLALQRGNDAAAAAQTVALAVAVENLRFRYAITGDAPPWRPLRAWDDGAKVYIEFPARLDQGEAPPLFVVGPLGDAQLVNYRVSGHHYIVDRLFAAAELRMGEAPQRVVRITRTDGDQRRGRRASQ